MIRNAGQVVFGPERLVLCQDLHHTTKIDDFAHGTPADRGQSVLSHSILANEMISLQLSQRVDDRRRGHVELFLESGKRFLPFVQGEEEGSPMLRANRKAVSYTHLRAHETRHDLVC